MFVQALFLLFVANGAPIVVRLLMHGYFSMPLDGGIQWFDGRPLLGRSKTWRGLLAALLLTSLVALSLGLSFYIGALFGLFAMFGDLLSSFIKRRCGIAPSGQALGLDQVPESLLPLLLLQSQLGLTLSDVAILVVIFTILELLISRLLYQWHIRKRPY